MDCIASTSTHLLKWFTARITYFLDVDAFGNGPRISSPTERKARGYQLLLTFLLVSKVCWHEPDTFDTSGSALLHPTSLWASSNPV